MDFLGKSEKEKVFYELYEKYRDMMYWAAFKVVKNDADAQDAVQNALICVLKRMDDLPDQKEKLDAYMIVTARHAAIDIYHANQKHLRLYDSIVKDIVQNGQRRGADPFHHAAATEEANHLLETLKQMNEDYCEIIMLYYYHNFSIKQIGELLGLTEKAAATKLHRARKAMEKALERQDFKADDIGLAAEDSKAKQTHKKSSLEGQLKKSVAPGTSRELDKE